MTEKYEYEINEKKYIQKPLVIGQVGQIIKLMEGLTIPQPLNAIKFVKVLDDRLPHAIAIVLTPEGVKLKDKDIEALEGEFAENLSIEVAIKAVEDFFDCNPISSILEKLNETLKKISGTINSQKMPSPSSSVSSQEETSQKGTESSGDTP